MIKDIVHGGTCDRVFSRSVAFKKDELRCSDGIVLPKTFLDMMDAKQRSQAMSLYAKGLLVVQICSATTFFSKRNKQMKELKTKHIQTSVNRQFLPTDVVDTEAKGLQKSDKVPKKLFVNVIILADEDRDLVKLPTWALKTLSMAEGQPLSVSLPRWPGSLHFYDAQKIELTPTTPSYFFVEQFFTDNPQEMPLAIQQALSRHKILTNGTEIELFIANKIVKFKIEIIAPEKQLQLLNNERVTPVEISLRITQELERLEGYAVTSHQPMQDSEVLLQEGLDLNAIMDANGLDLDLMEQMELEHKKQSQKVKNQNSMTPQFRGRGGQFMLKDLANGVNGIKTENKQLMGSMHMARVTEEAETPQASNVQHDMYKSSTWQSNRASQDIKASLKLSKRGSEPKSRQITRSGDEGTMSKLWPTIKIKSKTADRNKIISGYTKIEDQARMGEIRVGASNRFKGLEDIGNLEIAKIRRSASPSNNFFQQEKIYQHQRQQYSKFHQRNADQLTELGNHAHVEANNNNKKILTSFVQTRKQDDSQKFNIKLVRNPLESTLVVPFQQENMNFHQLSIVTASIDDSSRMPRDSDQNNSHREKHTILLSASGEKEQTTMYGKPKKLSLTNLNYRIDQNTPNTTYHGKSKNYDSKKLINHDERVEVHAMSSKHYEINGDINDDVGLVSDDLSSPGLLTNNLGRITNKIDKKANDVAPSTVQLHITTTGKQNQPDTVSLKFSRKDSVSKDSNPVMLASETRLVQDESGNTHSSNQLKNIKYVEGVCSNQDLRTQQNVNFIRQFDHDTNKQGTDSAGKLIRPTNYSKTKNIYTVLNKNKHNNNAQEYSVHSGSNNDIQSELLGRIGAPQFQNQQSNQRFTLQNAQRVLNKISSQALSVSRRPHSSAQRSSKLREHAVATIQSFKSGRNSGMIKKNYLSNNKTMADSQQSVFERLSQSRNFIKTQLSAGNEEFKNVLQFIESAHPDQYRLLHQPKNQNYGYQGCSKNHDHHEATLANLQSEVYKLDHSQLDENDKKRARSSHCRSKKYKNLVTQLKYNDLMLQRGVTGSPIASPSQLNNFTFSNLQLQEMLERNKTVMLNGSTTSPCNKATTLIINYELDQDNKQVLKRKVTTEPGNELLPTHMMATQGIHNSTYASKDASNFVKQHTVGVDRSKSISPTGDENMNKTVTSFQNEPQTFQAVENKKYSYRNQKSSNSNLKTRLNQANCGVKTGQLSKLFQKYNRYISTQRNLVDKNSSRPLSIGKNKEEAMYRLDALYLEQEQFKEQKLRKENRKVSKKGYKRRAITLNGNLSIANAVQDMDSRSGIIRKEPPLIISNDNSPVAIPRSNKNKVYISEHPSQQANYDTSVRINSQLMADELARENSNHKSKHTTHNNSVFKNQQQQNQDANSKHAAKSLQLMGLSINKKNSAIVGNDIDKHQDFENPNKLRDSIEVEEMIVEPLNLNFQSQEELQSKNQNDNGNSAFRIEPETLVDSLQIIKQPGGSDEYGDGCNTSSAQVTNEGLGEESRKLVQLQQKKQLDDGSKFIINEYQLKGAQNNQGCFTSNVINTSLHRHEPNSGNSDKERQNLMQIEQPKNTTTLLLQGALENNEMRSFVINEEQINRRESTNTLTAARETSYHTRHGHQNQHLQQTAKWSHFSPERSQELNDQNQQQEDIFEKYKSNVKKSKSPTDKHRNNNNNSNGKAKAIPSPTMTNKKLLFGNLGEGATLSNGENNIATNTDALNSSLMVKAIPNLAVDKIMVRKKKILLRQQPQPYQQPKILLKNQNVLDTQISKQQSALTYEKQHDDSVFNTNMLHLDEANPNAAPRLQFSPKSQFKPRKQISKLSSRTKWHQVKQKVAQSPNNYETQEIGDRSNIKYHKQSFTSTLTGRRVKALKTLVGSAKQIGQYMSPRNTTTMASTSCLETQQIILSQRSGFDQQKKTSRRKLSTKQ